MTTATAVRTAKPSTAAPRAAQQTPDWRAHALRMCSQLGDLVQAAMALDGGPEAWTLMNYGQIEMAKLEQRLADKTVLAGDTLSIAYDANACWLGAHSIPDTPIPIKAILAQVLPISDAIGTLLDETGAHESSGARANAERVGAADRATTDAAITRDPATLTTMAEDAPEIAEELLLWGTYEVEGVTDHLVEFVDGLHVAGTLENGDAMVLRSGIIRAHKINSLTMGFLNCSGDATLLQMAIDLGQVERLRGLITQEGGAA